MAHSCSENCEEPYLVLCDRAKCNSDSNVFLQHTRLLSIIWPLNLFITWNYVYLTFWNDSLLFVDTERLKQRASDRSEESQRQRQCWFWSFCVIQSDNASFLSNLISCCTPMTHNTIWLLDYSVWFYEYSKEQKTWAWIQPELLG